MKPILTYRDLLTLEDLLRDHIHALRHRAEEFGHELGCVIEADEATLERLREAIEAFPDEDL
jgi:hypothetical protein